VLKSLVVKVAGAAWQHETKCDNDRYVEPASIATNKKTQFILFIVLTSITFLLTNTKVRQLTKFPQNKTWSIYNNDHVIVTKKILDHRHSCYQKSQRESLDCDGLDRFRWTDNCPTVHFASRKEDCNRTLT
jgi:hypothetical protein